MTLRILGLDCSSKVIGYALLSSGVATNWGYVVLDGDIAARIRKAHQDVRFLVQTLRPELVVIESPAAVKPGGLIPQCRVSGAVILALHEEELLWHEVTPGQAKKALTGAGRADKKEMLTAAVAFLNLGPVALRQKNGKWYAVDGDRVLLSEDEADALGVAAAGLGVKVEVC